MARVPRENLGSGACPSCGERVSFYRTVGKQIAYKCDAHPCDHNSFAPEKSATAHRWLATIKTRLDLDDSPNSEPVEHTTAKAEPTKKVKNSVFALGDL